MKTEKISKISKFSTHISSPEYSLLDVEDVCRLLKVKRTWVYEQVRLGKIPKVPNLGKQVRFYPEVVKRLFLTDKCSLKNEKKNTGHKNSKEELWHA